MDLGEVIPPEYFHALIFKVPSVLLNPVVPSKTIGAPTSFFEKYVSPTNSFSEVKIMLVQSFDKGKNEYWRDGILQRCPEEVSSYITEPPSEFFENLYSSK